jgi:tetratricopeptide (TPR) repeat protein
MSYIKKRKSKKHGITPQEIITDERTLTHWISENVNTLIYTGGTILFVLIIAFGFVWMKTQKARAASEDLAGALSFYWSTVAQMPSDEPDLDTMKLEQALETFTDVAERHRKAMQGQSAFLYRANVLYRLGRFEEAALTLEEVDSRNAVVFSDIDARYLLAKCYEALGQYGKAIEVYSRMRGRALGEMQAVLAIDIARCSELTGDVQQAISQYQEVITDFPDSVFAVRSEKKLATLGVIVREEL